MVTRRKTPRYAGKARSSFSESPRRNTRRGTDVFARNLAAKNYPSGRETGYLARHASSHLSTNRPRSNFTLTRDEDRARPDTKVTTRSSRIYSVFVARPCLTQARIRKRGGRHLRRHADQPKFVQGGVASSSPGWQQTRAPNGPASPYATKAHKLIALTLRTRD